MSARLSARRSPSTRGFTIRAVSLALLALGVAPLVPGRALAQVPPPPPPPSAPAAPGAAPSGDAKASLAAGDKAAKAKDWNTALTQYQAAMAAQPSAAALGGIANAQYQLKLSGDAYDSYEQYLKNHGKQIGAHQKAEAEKRLKELASVTGYVSIRVNEPGATVLLDGKSLGTSPVAALIRVSAGSHKLEVTKDGFASVAQSPTVPANGKEIVDVTMTREATTGHLVVKEKSGQPVRVIVDGADVGAAPIDVEVAPGPHEVIVRSSSMAAPAQKVEITRGRATEVEMVAVAASAHLEITTSDRQGIVFLDGKPVAEGAFSGDVAVGPHAISVTRDGFEKFEKTVTLADKQTVAETVTLKHTASASSGTFETERAFDGLYGGIAALGLIQPGGNGNEFENRCNQLGAASCTTPAPIGGGLMGWFGYAWHPIGIEAFLAGEGDETTPAATFTAGPSATTNPLAVGIPRVEQYSIIRLGGMAAVRLRASFQTTRVRFSFAAGFGASMKAMELLRRAKGNDGTANAFSGGFQTYFSPALSLDGSVSLRLGQTTALAFGVLGWLETAGDSVQSAASPNEVLVSGSALHPIATPSYHYAQSTQVMVGPYIGVQFGP